MPTSAPIHTQIVITTNPIFSIIMRRGCHGCQTKTKQKKKGAAQKYPPSEVNFCLVPKAQETAVAVSRAVRQPRQGQLHTRGSFLGSRDFGTREEASPAEERLKKSQRTSSCFILKHCNSWRSWFPSESQRSWFFPQTTANRPALCFPKSGQSNYCKGVQLGCALPAGATGDMENSMTISCVTSPFLMDFLIIVRSFSSASASVKSWAKEVNSPTVSQV